MSLITKRLIALKEGQFVEIALHNGDVFSGIVTENDCEEAVAIENQAEELVVMYDDVKSVKVKASDTAATKAIPTAAPTVSVPTPFVQESVAPARAVKFSRPKYFKEIVVYQAPDSEITAAFSALNKYEKDLLKGLYNSLKYAITINDKPRIADVVNKTKHILLSEEADTGTARVEDEFWGGITTNAWYFLALMCTRCGEDNAEWFEKAGQLVNAAKRCYVSNRPDEALVYACASLLDGSCEGVENDVYNIITDASCKLMSFNELACVIDNNPRIIKNLYMLNMLDYLYRSFNKPFDKSALPETIIFDLKHWSCSGDNNALSAFLNKIEFSNKPEEPKKEKETDDVLLGDIIKNSWSREKGVIVSDDVEYDFLYSDITDEYILNKLKSFKFSDLAAKNCVLNVKFIAEGSHAKNVVGFKRYPKNEVAEKPVAEVKAPKPEEKPAAAEKEPDFSEYLKIGRDINTVVENENRFAESLVYFEKSIEEKQNICDCVMEAINCCLSLAKKGTEEDEQAYLERAYAIYYDNISSLKPHIEKGLKYNSILCNLFIKMNKTDEAKAAIDRILADPKLPNETRLHNIYMRSEVLYKKAVESGEKEDYIAALTDCRNWEQQYNISPSLKMNKSFVQRYNTVILTRIAHCLYETDEVELAKATINRVLDYDPVNAYALDFARKWGIILKEEEQEDSDENGEIEEDEVIEEGVLEEEVIDIPEYEDVSGWDALDVTAEDVVNYALGIKGKNRIPMIVSYIKAASLIKPLNSELVNFSNRIALAVNSPADQPNYSLSEVVLKFAAKTESNMVLDKMCFIAACMRSSFYYASDNDYFASVQYLDDDCYKLLPGARAVLTYLDEFRAKTGKGIDCCAKYRFVDVEANKNEIARLVGEAGTLYDAYFDRVFREGKSQLRFKLAKVYAFEKERVLEYAVRCVKNDDYSEFSQRVEEFKRTFLRANTPVSEASIAMDKIEQYINDAWDEAGKNENLVAIKSSKLMGSLRNNLRSAISSCLKTVCRWAELNESLGAGVSIEERIMYKETECKLMDALSELSAFVKNAGNDENENVEYEIGCEIIANMVSEFISRLDGTWKEENRKFFFADFLRTGNILLDDDFIPDFSATFCDLPEFNILYRIRCHIENEDIGFKERAQSVYEREKEKHDFGSAKQIYEYMRLCDDADYWSVPENADKCEEQSATQMTVSLDEFNEGVWYFSSIGKINKSCEFLNTVWETVNYWYHTCMQNKNHGFFFKLLENCYKKIDDEAQYYAQILLDRLELLKEEFEIDEEIENQVVTYINQQLFIIAEDDMARIQSNEFINGESTYVDACKCLEEFWSEFDENYNKVCDSGKSLNRLLINSAGSPAKDRKGSQALIENWPSSTQCGVGKIKSLLNLLGWENIEVVKIDDNNNKTDLFHVTNLDAIMGKRNFEHPIPAYGSLALESGFNVLCCYGYTTSERLIAEFQKHDGEVMNKIVLLDYALNQTERRALARSIKRKSFRSTYIVVDRVSILYIANHFVSGGNNKILMAISLPFAYVQPYVTASSGTIPPEMFIGRGEELVEVESPTGANIVYGGRQLGKSALLKKAKEECDEREKGRAAIFVDIKDLDYEKAALKVSREMILHGLLSDGEETSDWRDLVYKIKKSILENSFSYLLLLLDEADEFIYSCMDIDYMPMTELKDIQQTCNGKFKFVIAGLHNVVKYYKMSALGKNSVIPHFNSINIKPFEWGDARELLTLPLSYLGFSFEKSEELIKLILSTTNYYPGLIQLYCSKLVDMLKKPDYAGYNETEVPVYYITEKHISNILKNDDFLGEIKTKFEMTLLVDKNSYNYYIIALILAWLFEENDTAAGYPVEDIVKVADALGAEDITSLTEEQVNALLEELCELNILNCLQKKYTFRTKNFKDMLGSKAEIEEKLLEMITESENQEA